MEIISWFFFSLSLWVKASSTAVVASSTSKAKNRSATAVTANGAVSAFDTSVYVAGLVGIRGLLAVLL